MDEAFRRGEFDNGGDNLYATAAGAVQWIAARPGDSGGPSNNDPDFPLYVYPGGTFEPARRLELPTGGTNTYIVADLPGRPCGPACAAPRARLFRPLTCRLVEGIACRTAARSTRPCARATYRERGYLAQWPRRVRRRFTIAGLRRPHRGYLDHDALTGRRSSMGEPTVLPGARRVSPHRGVKQIADVNRDGHPDLLVPAYRSTGPPMPRRTGDATAGAPAVHAARLRQRLLASSSDRWRAGGKCGCRTTVEQPASRAQLNWLGAITGARFMGVDEVRLSARSSTRANDHKVQPGAAIGAVRNCSGPR